MNTCHEFILNLVPTAIACFLTGIPVGYQLRDRFMGER